MSTKDFSTDVRKYIEPKQVRSAIDEVLSGPLADQFFSGHFYLGGEHQEFPNSWQKEQVDSKLVLGVHESVPLLKCRSRQVELIGIGDIFNWRLPNASAQEIMDDFVADVSDVTEIIRKSKILSGRWVMIAKDQKRSVIFGDAWHSFAIYHGFDTKGRWWAASSPKLIGTPGTQELDEDIAHGVSPKLHAKSGGQYPVHITPFRHICCLLPNHCLDLVEQKAQRHWPYEKIKPVELVEASRIAAHQISQQILAMSQRYRLSCGLTAGTDSRLLLASLHHNNIQFDGFTSILDHWCHEHHFDVQVSEKLVERLGLKRQLIRAPEELSPDIDALFRACIYRPSWAHNRLAASYLTWPLRSTMNVIGWGSEINQRAWDIPDRDKPFKSDYLKCIDVPIQSPARDAVLSWAEETQQLRNDFGYQMFDLLFWEVRLGRFSATSLSDMNLIQKTVPAFNCREWFELILGATKSKMQPAVKMYSLMTKELAPSINTFDINPGLDKLSFNKWLRHSAIKNVRVLLKGVGLYRPLKNCLFERNLRRVRSS
ncbi:MAG: hypothetical protein AAF603_03080 [Pseudomonadota bacterium]